MTPDKSYSVNEVFYSLQGEGAHVGRSAVFIRFAGCNLRCAMEPGERSPGGFDCDTEFVSGRRVSIDELVQWLRVACGPSVCLADIGWAILTGGEPALQVDAALVQALHAVGLAAAIETNASIAIPDTWGLDWITASPKVAEHAVRLARANEVKYVRGYGQPIPKPTLTADHYFLSPAFQGLDVDRLAVDWCVKLCMENPKWRLTGQMHKLATIR